MNLRFVEGLIREREGEKEVCYLAQATCSGSKPSMAIEIGGQGVRKQKGKS